MHGRLILLALFAATATAQEPERFWHPKSVPAERAAFVQGLVDGIEKPTSPARRRFTGRPRGS